MKVFLTGGTGLLGHHILRALLESGHTVNALVRTEAAERTLRAAGATTVRGHVENPHDWRSAHSSDAIVHAAALVTQSEPWDTFRSVNVGGAEHALHAAAAGGRRLVHISSVAVYGREPVSPTRAVIDELTPFADLNPNDFYARSKRFAEAHLWDRSDDLKVLSVAIRPCVVYGEWDRTFLPRIIRILRGGVAPLVGSGHNALAIVYAGNVAEAVAAVLSTDRVRGPFNITNDGTVTQREFFTKVAAAMGKRLKFVRVPLRVAMLAGGAVRGFRKIARPARYPSLGPAAVRFLAAENRYSSARARRELGWRPSTTPDTAIARSIEWFLQRA